MSYNFTICIPTYNRGKRVYSLVNKLLSEIKKDWKILVLDNCSTNEANYYEKIRKLSLEVEALEYARQPSNIRFEGNYFSCFDHVTTNYMMIISDEDFPVIENIEQVLYEMNNNPDIGITRGSIGEHPDTEEKINVIKYNDVKLKKGKESLLSFSFMNNYVSGTIYNHQKIKEFGIIDRLSTEFNKYYVYPHLYMDMLITSKCESMTSSLDVILEGPSVVTYDEAGNRINNTSNAYITPYSFGSRIEQFIVFRDAVYLLSKELDENLDVMFYIKLYLKLVEKYFYLITCVNGKLYTDIDLSMPFLQDAFFNIACSGVTNYPETQMYNKLIIQRIADLNQKYKSISEKES